MSASTAGGSGGLQPPLGTSKTLHDETLRDFRYLVPLVCNLFQALGRSQYEFEGAVCIQPPMQNKDLKGGSRPTSQGEQKSGRRHRDGQPQQGHGIAQLFE